MRSPQQLEQRRLELEIELGGQVTLDGLAGPYKLFQRKKGYRHSVDDILTAHFAVSGKNEKPSEVLDLGIGIGCVGLAVAWYFQDTTVTGVEAQDISVALLRQNIWANNLESRVNVVHQDLRDFVPQIQQTHRYSLITASPPYFDVKNGILPADSQAAHCRFEMRGDIFDYARCAAAWLHANGRFVFCFPSVQHGRVLRALGEAQLHLNSFQRVIPKENVPSLFSLYEASKRNTPTVECPPLTVRDANGTRTQQMHDVYSVFQI
jgi:tRNA1Val (adenine37-N6)-methyltransferase